MQLFRFIDVFPMLHTPDLVHDYLVDYLTQPGVTLPPGMGLGLKAGGLAKGMMAKTIASQITSMARQLHRRRGRRLRPAHAEKAMDRGRGLQRRSAGRGLRERRGSRRLSAPLPRPGRDAAGHGGRVAGEPAAGKRPSRPDPADQRLDQDQFALRPDRPDRLRGLAPRVDGRLAADPESGGEEQRAASISTWSSSPSRT